MSREANAPAGGEAHGPLRREWLAVHGLLAAVALACVFFDWAWRADLALYDAALVVWQRPAPKDLVIVAIDERSVGEIGRWPWRRAVHATLLNHLTQENAAGVGLDILFSEADPNDPASDDSLAAAARRNGRVVLPIAQVVIDGRESEPRLPMPLLADAAAALGYAHVELDADGLARRFYPRGDPAFGNLPHFAWSLAASSRSGKPAAAPAGGAPALLPFAGPPGHFQTVSYVDVLRGALPAGFFRDKLVLVGVTASGLGDSFAAPFTSHNRPFNGVELQANMTDAIRRGILVSELPKAATAGLALITGIALLFGLRRASPRSGLLLSASACAVTLALSLVLLRAGQLWYAPSAALLVCILAYPLWSWRRLEAAQRFLDLEFERAQAEPALFVESAPPQPDSTDQLQRRIDTVRRAVEVRQAARRFIAEALDTMSAGVLIADRRGRVLLANRRAFELLELDQMPVVGRPLSEALAGLRLPHSVEEVLAAAARDGAQQIEAGRGRERAFLAGVAALQGEHGGSPGWIVNLVEISELRRAQQVRDEMMRFVSHDLRAPLASIISMTDVMQEPDAEAAGMFNLGQVQAAARRALNLAEDFMRLARAEVLDPRNFRLVDLHTLAMQAADEVSALALRRQIAIALGIEPPVGSAFCAGDADLLARAIVNLLTNALTYSPAQTTVAFGLRREAEHWALSVADQGPGIPEQELPRLFQRFSRLSTSQGREGTGLGLVIVKTVVERHGGTVEVANRPEGGACMTLRLPAAGTAG
jgi:hypothetical protein